MDEVKWTVDVWEDDRTGRCPFDAWFGKLDEYEQAVVDAVISNILEPLGMTICDTEWGKALGGGLYEVRIRRKLSAIRTWGAANKAAEPVSAGERSVLLRLFVAFQGDRVVVLFQGYNKGKDPSARRQAKEIETARKHLRAWKSQQKRVGRP
jgi:hypothetical protein